jgi:hypothetical protein
MRMHRIPHQRERAQTRASGQKAGKNMTQPNAGTSHDQQQQAAVPQATQQAAPQATWATEPGRIERDPVRRPAVAPAVRDWASI